MAKITQEKIELINELYLQYGVKAQVAREVGCSPATVTKYIIPDYVSKSKREKKTYDIKINQEESKEAFVHILNDKNRSQEFLRYTALSTEEIAALNEFKKELYL